MSFVPWDKWITKFLFSISDAFVNDHVDKAKEAYKAKDLDGYFKNAVALRYLDLTLPENTAKNSIAEVSNQLQALHQQVGAELTRQGKWELKYYLWQVLCIVPAAGPNLRAVLGNRLHELEAALTGETLCCVANKVVMEWAVAMTHEDVNKEKWCELNWRIYL